MILEVESQKPVSCGEARSFVLGRLRGKFDDTLVATGSPEFQRAVEIGVHLFSCPTKICQFLGLTVHIRNSGTEIDLEATMKKLAKLEEEEHFF